MQILDGKATSQAIRAELMVAVENRRLKGQKIPHLVAVLIGNDGGSLTYVGAKVKACKEIGFESTGHGCGFGGEDFSLSTKKLSINICDTGKEVIATVMTNDTEDPEELYEGKIQGALKFIKQM